MTFLKHAHARKYFYANKSYYVYSKQIFHFCSFHEYIFRYSEGPKETEQILSGIITKFKALTLQLEGKTLKKHLNVLPLAPAACQQTKFLKPKIGTTKKLERKKSLENHKCEWNCDDCSNTYSYKRGLI